jgi:Kef-type K+ transport system membrane component KefB
MEVLLLLLIVLVVTRTFGEVAHRLRQPALLGELIAGIALGVVATRYAHLTPILAESKESPLFLGLTELGIFFLMLYGGVELRASELAEVSAKSLVIATCGLLVPILAGFALGWVFLPTSEFKVAQCLLIGTALAITAVPTSIRVPDGLGPTAITGRKNDRFGGNHR